eukprot:4464059-Karenia_brevis.AAC.1
MRRRPFQVILLMTILLSVRVQGTAGLCHSNYDSGCMISTTGDVVGECEHFLLNGFGRSSSLDEAEKGLNENSGANGDRVSKKLKHDYRAGRSIEALSTSAHICYSDLTVSDIISCNGKQ